MTQTDQRAPDYERILEAKVVSFEMLASANVQAEARAQQFASLVDAQHELLSNLQQQALPVTASALEMGLQQGVALRDGLLAAGVRDATRRAQAIFGSNLEGATGAQTRLEAENLDQMRAAIAALGKAQALITDRTDKAIERGLNSMELVEQVKMSAGRRSRRHGGLPEGRCRAGQSRQSRRHRSPARSTEGSGRPSRASEAGDHEPVDDRAELPGRPGHAIPAASEV